MTTESIIKLLVTNETKLTQQKNTALARGRWLRAIEIEAQEKYSVDLRMQITTLEAAEHSAEDKRNAIIARGIGGPLP